MFAPSAEAGPAPSTSAQIHFYSNIGDPINGTFIKNPLLVRPSTLILFEDGSWFLKGLHWSGWGSSVAVATGTSSSSPCGPSCPASRWSNTPAQFTLSSPGVILGHEVYRCFQLTVPSYPPSDMHECLELQGKYYGYASVGSPSPPAAVKRRRLPRWLSRFRRTRPGSPAY